MTDRLRFLKSPDGRALEHAAREATVRLCLAARAGHGVREARAAWREARRALLAWYRSRPREGWKRRPKQIAQRIAACAGDGVFRRAHGRNRKRPQAVTDWSGVELRWRDRRWCLVETGRTA